MKKYLLSLFFLIFSFFVFADEGGFVIENYAVNAKLAHNNEIFVTEKIDVRFLEPRHGLYREINLRMKIPFKKSENKVFEKSYKNEIRDIKVFDKDFSVNIDGNKARIRAGNSEKLVTGKQSYVISYSLLMKEDRVKDIDVFYYSVLGNEWNVPIENFDFFFEFENPVQKDAVSVFSGKKGEKSNALNVNYFFDDLHIKGNVKNTPKNNAVTFYLKLPEGYFYDCQKEGGIFSLITGILSFIFSVFVILRSVFTKHLKPQKKEEYFTPKNLVSLEAGFIIDNRADLKDVLSMIFFWAQKGYLELIECRSNKDCSFIKIKKIKSLEEKEPEYQKLLFNAFFEDKDEFSFANLNSAFKPKIIRAKKELKNYFSGEKNLYKNKKMSRLFNLISAFFYCLVLISGNVFGIAENFYLIFLVIPLFLVNCINISVVNSRFFLGKIKLFFLRLLSLIFTLLVFSVSLFFKDENVLPFNFYFICQTLSILSCFLSFLIIERTEYNIEMTEKILAIKRYITNEKIVMDENCGKNYFDVLPFAIVFGIFKKWSKLFYGANIISPVWYHSIKNPTFFNTLDFYKNFNEGFISAFAEKTENSGYDCDFSAGSGSGAGGGGGGSW